jgi:hypothetical protein
VRTLLAGPPFGFVAELDLRFLHTVSLEPTEAIVRSGEGLNAIRSEAKALTQLARSGSRRILPVCIVLRLAPTAESHISMSIGIGRVGHGYL